MTSTAQGKHLSGDRGGVSRRRVDDHVGDPGPEGLARLAQPLADHCASASFDLPEQALIAGQIDEAGVPGISAHPASADLLDGEAIRHVDIHVADKGHDTPC